jgi:hypothetical protein
MALLSDCAPLWAVVCAHVVTEAGHQMSAKTHDMAFVMTRECASPTACSAQRREGAPYHARKFPLLSLPSTIMVLDSQTCHWPSRGMPITSPVLSTDTASRHTNRMSGGGDCNQFVQLTLLHAYSTHSLLAHVVCSTSQSPCFPARALHCREVFWLPVCCGSC